MLVIHDNSMEGRVMGTDAGRWGDRIVVETHRNSLLQFSQRSGKQLTAACVKWGEGFRALKKKRRYKTAI